MKLAKSCLVRVISCLTPSQVHQMVDVFFINRSILSSDKLIFGPDSVVWFARASCNGQRLAPLLKSIYYLVLDEFLKTK